MPHESYDLIETIGGIALSVIAAVALFMFAVSLIDRHPGAKQKDETPDDARMREP
ncbi:hypothetical protein Pla123a_02650 [Posidoniimonas polymericola]|uniref:Uncharacterized protein n=1 Tax=Posidoniimonas polymericola TaxID=2528002 RepID=A0A5C5ZE67_9BACT|nr:hypothetical protein [Posidoniimonas polymericola]TWT85458.1 hypothetical protein Pla123a_02650 [Posidoniimonas polymericola]